MTAIPQHRWKPEEDIMLLSLRCLNLPFVEIAKRMGKTKGQVAGRLWRLNGSGYTKQEKGVGQ